MEFLSQTVGDLILQDLDPASVGQEPEQAAGSGLPAFGDDGPAPAAVHDAGYDLQDFRTLPAPVRQFYDIHAVMMVRYDQVPVVRYQDLQLAEIAAVGIFRKLPQVMEGLLHQKSFRESFPLDFQDFLQHLFCQGLSSLQPVPDPQVEAVKKLAFHIGEMIADIEIFIVGKHAGPFFLSPAGFSPPAGRSCQSK